MLMLAPCARTVESRVCVITPHVRTRIHPHTARHGFFFNLWSNCTSARPLSRRASLRLCIPASLSTLCAYRTTLSHARTAPVHGALNVSFHLVHFMKTLLDLVLAHHVHCHPPGQNNARPKVVDPRHVDIRKFGHMALGLRWKKERCLSGCIARCGACTYARACRSRVCRV